MDGNEQISKEYLTTKEAASLLGVSSTTLIQWENSNKINCFRTHGGHRRYSRKQIIERRGGYEVPAVRIRYAYCRVSTRAQKEDLERQVQFFRDKYPDYTIVKDIGSGLNFKRKGLNSILEQIQRGNVEEIVVTHKDRLSRFGFELIEKILQMCSGGKIVVLDTESDSPQQELINDLVSIITVFSSRIYGLRSGSIKKAIKKACTQIKPNVENFEDTTIPDRRGEGTNVLPL